MADRICPNTKIRWSCAAAGVFLVLPSLASAQQYHLTDLGTVFSPGGTSYGFEVNSQGQCVGFSGGSQAEQVPAIYTNGSGMQSLGNFGSDFLGMAVDINDSGQAVGFDYFAGGSGSQARALLWSGGSVTDIGALGSTLNAYAYGINNAGQVVGEDDASGARAFSWTQGGGIVALAPLSGQTNSSASDVDSTGVVVGSSGNLGTKWVNGVPSPISASESLGPAYFINGLGHVTGSNGPSTYLWRSGQATVSLGLLPGLANANGGSLNDADVVVGTAFNNASDPASAWRAWVWDSQHGMRDLNSLVDSSGAGWTLFEAGGINNQGQISGTGLSNNGTVEHAFRLEPVPEPSGVLAIGLGCLILCRRRRTVEAPQGEAVHASARSVEELPRSPRQVPRLSMTS
ncbi:MAG: PEP-CTERM sorting domain-containing protein [Fimbriimonadales bacterium]